MSRLWAKTRLASRPQGGRKLISRDELPIYNTNVDDRGTRYTLDCWLRVDTVGDFGMPQPPSRLKDYGINYVIVDRVLQETNQIKTIT